jgi:hypothetical protein
MIIFAFAKYIWLITNREKNHGQHPAKPESINTSPILLERSITKRQNK